MDGYGWLVSPANRQGSWTFISLTLHSDSGILRTLRGVAPGVGVCGPDPAGWTLARDSAGTGTFGWSGSLSPAESGTRRG